MATGTRPRVGMNGQMERQPLAKPKRVAGAEGKVDRCRPETTGLIWIFHIKLWCKTQDRPKLKMKFDREPETGLVWISLSCRWLHEWSINKWPKLRIGQFQWIIYPLDDEWVKPWQTLWRYAISTSAMRSSMVVGSESNRKGWAMRQSQGWKGWNHLCFVGIIEFRHEHIMDIMGTAIICIALGYRESYAASTWVIVGMGDNT